MSYYREARGHVRPFRNFLLYVFFFGLVPLAAIIGTVGYFAGWFSEAAQVTRHEFGPKAMLRKYEWFKDAAAALDKKTADLAVYESRLRALEQAYVGVPRAKWPRDDREQMSLWQSECAGVAASHNALAADYNSQMAKMNWKFANVGDLPAGATSPLPREFKEYIVK